MRWLNRQIAESARLWQLALRKARWIFWMPLVGAVVVILVRFNKDLFRFLLREDGPVEWAQFFCFAFAAVAAMTVARYRWLSDHGGQAILFALAALTLIGVAGEEIAWGQRVLGLKTPEVLKVINKQQEITLHNIDPILSILKPMILAAGAIGAAAWLVNGRMRLQRYWDQAEFLLIPPFFLASSFFVVFGYQFVRHTIWIPGGFTVTSCGEWAEFCLAFALAVFLGLNAQRLGKFAQEEKGCAEPALKSPPKEAGVLR